MEYFAPATAFTGFALKVITGFMRNGLGGTYADLGDLQLSAAVTQNPTVEELRKENATINTLDILANLLLVAAVVSAVYSSKKKDSEYTKMKSPLS